MLASMMAGPVVFLSEMASLDRPAASAAGAMMREGGSMWGKAAQGLSRVAQLLGNSGISIGPGGAIFTNPDAAMAGARMTGADKQKQLEEDPTYQFGENLAAGAQEAFPTNPLFADKLETAVASGAGSVFGLIPSALAGPAAPLVAGAGYGMSAGETAAEEAQAILDSRIQAALEQGDMGTAATLEQDKFGIQTAAFLATAPIGAGTEGALGVAGRLAGMARGKGGMLGGITDKVVNSLAKSQTVKRGVEGMVSESLQEGLEQVGGNLVAKGLYDPERDITEGLGMSMMAGGLVGGGFGAGAGALADRQSRISPVEPTVPEVTIAPESASEVQAMLDALAGANEVTKDNFTDAEAITPEMEVPVDVTPPPVEAPVDVTPPPPPVEEQADLQAELDAQVSAGTTEAPPTPESPEQIEAQLEATLDPESTKAVTLVTPETPLPEIPEGLEVGETTEAGTPIFNPEKITPKLVTEAGQGEVYDPQVLGLGAEVAQSDTAVTTSTPEGTPVLEELVTPETITAAIEAQQAAVPGGITEVKPAAQVVAKRREDTTSTPKQPWEMTKSKWESRDKSLWGDLSAEGTGLNAARTYHKVMVRDAVREGKPVPQEVLDDYPEFSKGTKKISSEEKAPKAKQDTQSKPTPSPEAPTQGQPTPTPPGSAPSPDAGKQGVGVQSPLKGGEITNEEEKGKLQEQGQVADTPEPKLDPDRNRGPVTDTPAKAEEKIENELDSVAATSGTRSAKDIKEELVERLTTALESAPVEESTKRKEQTVVISIPGDGTFTISNTKANIANVLKRAKAIHTSKGDPWPTQGARGSTVPKLGKGLKASDVVKELQQFMSMDENRKSINQVYAETGRAIATSGALLIEVKGKFDPNDNENAKFPIGPVDAVLKNAKDTTRDTVSISTEQLTRIARMAQRISSEDIPGVSIFADKNGKIYAEAKERSTGDTASIGDKTTERFLGSLDSNLIEKVAKFARKMGDESVTFSRNEGYRQSDGSGNPTVTYEGKGWKAIQAGLKEDPWYKQEPSMAKRLLAALTRLESQIESNTYSDPLLLTVFAKLAIKLARQLIKGGMAINQAIRQAVADARKQMPDAPDDDAAVADKIEREIQAEDAKTGTGELLTPAPGEKVQESKGRFTGLVSKDTDKEWQKQAEEWLSQFGDDLETAYQKTISPVTPVDAALRQYVLTELLARTDAAIKTKNPVTQMAMLRLQAAIADSLKDSGKQEFGTVGAARAQALKRIEWLMPVLMLRGLVKDAQSRLPFPDITSDKVRDWLKRAGSKAVSEVRKAMKDADNVVSRELKREVKDLGVNWGDIIRSSEAVQGDFRRALYRTVLEHPKLTGITPKAVTEIVNLLANEWERQRLRIFRQEFSKEVKLPNVSDRTMNRLEEAIPAIVIQANVGLLDNEAFRNAVAPKFGVEQFDSKTADLVYKLAQEAQGMKGVNRTKLLNRITDTIQRAGGVAKSDVFRDYWFAAMLSGVKTMVDNGLGILSGGLTTSLAMMRNPSAVPLMTRAYLSGLSEAGSDFVPILKGERWRTHNVDIDRPASALDAMLASPNPFKKAIGTMAYVSRLISALDHLNALSTRQAMMAWAAMRSDPAIAEAMVSVTPEQRAEAREQALQEGTEKGLLNKRIREILEERVPVEMVLTATQLGLIASFQNDPYGVAGHFYQFIKRLDELPGFGKFTRLVSGVAFARYALNYTNDILNYMSPIGMIRWYASSPGMQDKPHGLKITEEERQLIMMKSVMGSLVAAVAAAVFLGDDDDDEKERAIDITGSFKSLDPEKRNQLLSEKRQPYSIRFGDTYVSYRQLPIAGILGTVGEMRDKQLFAPDKWKEQNPSSTVANAAIAGMFIVRDSSALTGLMDLLGFASAYKYDTEAMVDKSIPRFVARLLGGMIPNIAKEIDAWQDPAIYKATQGWEYFLQQVPWGRRSLEPGPQVNVLGEKIAVERLPWSRWVKERSKEPEWDTLGKLADKGIFMPVPGEFSVQNDDGTRRKPTKKEMYDYQKAVGESYKGFIKDEGRDLLDMEPAEAKRLIDRTTTRLRKQARMELGI